MIEKVNVLGVGVSAINMDIALETLDQWIQEQKKSRYVCITGVHGIIESQNDESLRRIHNHAGLVTPDGMPMVWIGKLDGKRWMKRVYGPDLMLAMCHQSLEKGYRHYFYGGAEGVPELLAEKLQQKFPNLQVIGTYSPPFRALTSQEDEEIVQMINQANPDIVWIGLSTPKQERWMAAHVDELNASVLIGVGAAFDFHAGLKKQAPRWMQRSGLEWFFRMVTEPKRLGSRYLKSNPTFIKLMLMQKLGLREYMLEP